jgi:hypothetical protein
VDTVLNGRESAMGKAGVILGVLISADLKDVREMGRDERFRTFGQTAAHKMGEN